MNVQEEDVLDHCPGLYEGIYDVKGHRDKLGPKSATLKLKKLCRSGKSVRFNKEEQNAETSAVQGAIINASRRKAFGWGPISNGYARVYLATFRNLTPGIRMRGFVASTDLEWVEKELNEFKAKGYEVIARSWE